MIVLRKIKQSTNLVVAATLTKVADSTVDVLFNQYFPTASGVDPEQFYGKVFTTPDNFKSDKIYINYNGQQLTEDYDFEVWGDNVVSFKYVSPNENFEIINATYELA